MASQEEEHASGISAFLGEKIGPAMRKAFKPIDPLDTSVFYSAGPRLSRRDLFKRSAKEAGHTTSSLLEGPWDLIQDIVNGIADATLGRRKLMAGMVALLGVGIAIGTALENDPELLQDVNLRLKLDSVWDEVKELQSPPTHQELLDKVHNAFEPIQISGDELDNAIIVDDEDSEGVPDGIRKNSLGPEQPDSWPLVAAKKLTAGLRVLGRSGTVKGYDFAQPGASSKGLADFEDPEGNVQLGAKTRADMAADHAGEPTPTEVMINHEGFLFAACGLHGDDMRDTADLLLKYVDPESPNFNAAFADFLYRPRREKLNNDIVVNILKKVLTSYKDDKTRIKTNFQKALDDYEAINTSRLKARKGRMVLIVSQPPALDEYDTVPYVHLGTQQGVTGTLNLNQYGAAGRLAALWTMTPFYMIEGPMLKDFQQRTGIKVTSTPLLAIQIPKDHLAKDSHLNLLGHRDRANTVVALVEVADGDTNLAFQKDGSPKSLAA